MPIIVIGLVSQVAVGLVGFANKVFDLKTDSSIQVILIVVLFGIGTDYILFFLFRYRERLREGEESRAAVAHAVERAGEAIASAGGAVIVSFMALVLSSLGIFKSIGPALAIAVSVTVLAALTLVPAIVGAAGHQGVLAVEVVAQGAGGGPVRRRRPVAGSAPGAATPSPPAACSPCSRCSRSASTRTSTSATPALPPTWSPSVALKTLQKGLPAGATDPTQVFLTSDDGTPIDKAEQTAYAEALGKADGRRPGGARRRERGGDTAAFNVVLDQDPTSDAVARRREGPDPDDGARRGTGRHRRPWSAARRRCSSTSRRR